MRARPCAIARMCHCTKVRGPRCKYASRMFIELLLDSAVRAGAKCKDPSLQSEEGHALANTAHGGFAMNGLFCGKGLSPLLACFVFAVEFWSPSARAASHALSARMTGGQEVPAIATAASGTCSATVDDATGNVTFTGSFSGLGAAANKAALDGPATATQVGPALLSAGALSFATTGTFSGSGTLTPAEVTALLRGEGYCEVRDVAFPSGEVRGQLLATTPVPAFPWPSTAVLALVLSLCAALAVRARAAA